MDAAGKDSTIKHVMSGVNPQGCQVYSFKAPSAEELDHDYLWRTARRLPERGRIGIFNRSYYEEVLIVKVHPELVTAQRIPGADAGDLLGLPGVRHSCHESVATGVNAVADGDCAGVTLAAAVVTTLTDHAFADHGHFYGDFVHVMISWASIRTVHDV